MNVWIFIVFHFVSVLASYGPKVSKCPDIQCVPLDDDVPKKCRRTPIRRPCLGCEINRCCPRPCPSLPPGTPATCITEVFINGPDCPYCAFLAEECGGGPYLVCPNIRCPPLDGVPQDCISKGDVISFKGKPCRLCPSVINAPRCKSFITS